jgi:hypothetical protein
LIRDRLHRLFCFLAHTGSAIFVPEIQPVSRIDFQEIDPKIVREQIPNNQIPPIRIAIL